MAEALVMVVGQSRLVQHAVPDQALIHLSSSQPHLVDTMRRTAVHARRLIDIVTTCSVLAETLHR